MKMKISFLSFFQVMEQRWNETDGGKPKNSGEKLALLPLCPPQIHMDWAGIEPRPAANRLSHSTALGLSSRYCCHCKLTDPMNSIWVTDPCTICCTLSLLLVLPPTASLTRHKILHYEHAWYVFTYSALYLASVLTKIRIFSKTVVFEGMDWADLAQDRVRCRSIVNAVMNLHKTRGISRLLSNCYLLKDSAPCSYLQQCF
jgi:hypothetical protein